MKILIKSVLSSVCQRCWSRRLFIDLKQRNILSTSSCLATRSVNNVAYTSSSGSESDTDHSDGEVIHDEGDYLHHIPTTPLQKLLLSVGAATMAITNPQRGDMVAALGETTGQLALVKMRRKMLEDPTGKLILQEQPRINTSTVDLDYLRSLPEGTLGRHYVGWLDINRASPDEREPVHFVDDVDLAYVMQRYRETHDLFHTVLGMPTNMLGEIVVKWVEAIQLGLPMCVLGALFGPVRLGPKHMEIYLKSHLWWALRNGQNAKFLMNIYYEKHWDWPLEELRKHLNIEQPPTTPERKHQT